MNKSGESITHPAPVGSNGPPVGAHNRQRVMVRPAGSVSLQRREPPAALREVRAHPSTNGGVPGFHFAVWAPNADYVSVVGDFNGWDRGPQPLARDRISGVWGGFIPGVRTGILLQVPHRRARRVHRREDRPVRLHMRGPAEDGRGHLGPGLQVERCRLDGQPRTRRVRTTRR